MKGADKDQWIHLLMDERLTPGQRKDLELRIASLPQASSEYEREKSIRSFLKEMGVESPHTSHPDFMWSKVKEGIESSSRERKTFRSKSLFASPRWGWAMACALLVLGLGSFILFEPEPQEKVVISGSTYSSIRGVQTYSPDVVAATYRSKGAGATVIWLSGWDSIADSFSEIWNTYTYQPSIMVTAYDSKGAGATVIWVSGMDDDERPDRTSL